MSKMSVLIFFYFDKLYMIKILEIIDIFLNLYIMRKDRTFIIYKL